MVESDNKRMAKNTLLMYLRMFVLIIVQLYTVPIVLQVLGVDDYGIYNVVGGFVVMFTFINGSLVSGCQRFLAYAIGQGNKEKLKEVFDSSFCIFFVLAIALFLLLELIGVWFLNTRMNIPGNRMMAANFVLQLSIFSLVVTILCTPFNSTVIAHEKMSIYAYASLFESFYKLFIAICLTIVSSDKLIVYAWLIFSSSVILGLFYFFYCLIHFPECKNIRIRYNRTLLKDIGTYAGWNVIGSLAILLRNHGLNIVMNIFFSPVMNTAHTIAAHINGVFNQFVSNVYVATRPQMVKQYAQGNVCEMWDITLKSGKYAFFLMTFIIVPVLIELPLLLKLWLHDVPNYTVTFSRMMVLSLAIETMTNQLIGAFQAANKIKYYQSVSSIILLSVVPLSYVILLINSSPVLPYIVYVLVSLAYIVSLLIVAHKQLGLDVITYIKSVILKDLMVILPSLLLTYVIAIQIQESYWRILFSICLSLLLTTSLVWSLGLNYLERTYIRRIIVNKFIRRNQ